MRGIPGAYLQDLLLPRRKPRTRKAAGRGRGGKNERKKKVRWKRMYVGHVAAGIASMCHRGNHAGNAEAHLTTLPPCIYLPRAIPYIFTVSVLPQTVRLLRPSRALLYPPYLLPSFSASAVPRHVLQRNSRDAEIRTRKIRKTQAVLAILLDFKRRAASCIFLIFQLFFLSFLFFVKIENERKRENRFSFFRPTILHFFHSIIIETQLSMFLLLLLPKEPRKYS